MGNWYRVTKRINGRFYDYWQRTYRVGKSVKTDNKYIGPSNSAATSTTKVQSQPDNPKTPWTPEQVAQRYFDRHHGITGELRTILGRIEERERREDERIQFGPLAQRKAKHRAAFNAVKKKGEKK